MSALLTDEPAPGVLRLTLNRPRRLNALDGPTLTALLEALRAADASEGAVRCVILRGTGRAFSTGSDLKWLADGVLADPAAHMRHQDRMQAAYELIETCRPVVVAEVNGLALAGGFEMALACDIIVAADEAELGDEHIRKNLLPSGGSTQRLPRKIGLARGLYHLLTGRRMTGRQAAEIGLAALSAPGADLEGVVLDLARGIAATDAHALAAMKRTVRRGMDLPLTEALSLERWMQYRYRNDSPAMLASVQAFAAKR